MLPKAFFTAYGQKNYMIEFSNILSNLLFKKKSVGIINRWIRHLIAGGLGTLIYFVGVAFFVEILSLHPVHSSIVSFLLMEAYIYVIQRIWVYQSSQSHGYCFPRYVVVTIIALLLNAGLMYAAVEMMSWHYIWGLVITTLIVPPTNFLLNYYWAFK